MLPSARPGDHLGPPTLSLKSVTGVRVQLGPVLFFLFSLSLSALPKISQIQDQPPPFADNLRRIAIQTGERL